MTRRSSWVPARGEVIWLTFTPQSGHEQGGRRPAVVLSPQSYNARVGMALVVPVTRVAKGYPFEVPVPDDAAVHGVVLCDQLKVLDWRARLAEPAGMLPPPTLAQVLARARVLLD